MFREIYKKFAAIAFFAEFALRFSWFCKSHGLL